MEWAMHFAFIILVISYIFTKIISKANTANLLNASEFKHSPFLKVGKIKPDNN